MGENVFSCGDEGADEKVTGLLRPLSLSSSSLDELKEEDPELSEEEDDTRSLGAVTVLPLFLLIAWLVKDWKVVIVSVPSLYRSTVESSRGIGRLRCKY